MQNPLDKINLDAWYKVVMVVGIFVFALSGAGILKEFPVVPTALISLGMFFIGLGEWINHPLQHTVRPGFIGRGYPRRQSFAGIVFDILGIALIGYGCVDLFL